MKRLSRTAAGLTVASLVFVGGATGATGPRGLTGPQGPSNAYAAYNPSFVAVTGAATVESVTVPAGSYVVNAKVVPDSPSAQTDGHCDLKKPERLNRGLCGGVAQPDQ